MTDLRTLASPFDRLAAVLELAAAANNGHVAHEPEVRARRSGDVLTLDVALWMASPSGDTLFAIELYTGTSPADAGVVEAAASRLTGLDARGAAVASATGFSRPARKKADESGVALIDLHDSAAVTWPSWLALGAFESQELHWNVRNVLLPPLPGLPERFFETVCERGDALFANPQGRRFTPEELVRRWLRGGNDSLLMDSLPPDGRRVERPILLRFDRPMTLLANTVRSLPALAGCEVVVEAWLEAVRVPMTLTEDPPESLDGAPRVAYASAPAPGDESGSRLWMWLAAPVGEEGALRIELIPGIESPALEPAEGLSEPG